MSISGRKGLPSSVYNVEWFAPLFLTERGPEFRGLAAMLLDFRSSRIGSMLDILWISLLWVSMRLFTSFMPLAMREIGLSPIKIAPRSIIYLYIKNAAALFAPAKSTQNSPAFAS